MKKRVLFALAILVGTAVLVGQMQAGAAGDGGTPCTTAQCGENSGPDVIVGNLLDIWRWGTIDGVTAYSVGTESCNTGTENLLWIAASNQHPVIGQNMYRLKDGRFEQIGIGWLKHGFTALTLNLCGCGCNGQGGSVLGVGCSDPYGGSLNGDQHGFGCGGGNVCGGLGPLSEVNPATGDFAYPYGRSGEGFGVLDKRIQVDNDYVDPALNDGALYYSQGHYVSPDDAKANNHHNNASYERMVVGTFQNGGWNLSNTGSTTRGCPAIYAWQDNDPNVMIRVADDFDKGRFYVAHNVTDNGNGTWHYEYAIQNLNSHRAGREFMVPVGAGATITNIEFKDIHHHSGDGNVIGIDYDGTDWAVTVGAGSVTWNTDTEDADPNANALRWGSLYNFRFDADTPPQQVVASLGLYRAGAPSAIDVIVDGPAPGGEPCPWDCADQNGTVATADLLELLAQWGGPGSCDFDGGGVSTADLLKLLGQWGACP
ncbi:MAG: hypothetical protein ACYS0D_12775 [Planctomycetota bacterium]|jgi:hypothetical protein